MNSKETRPGVKKELELKELSVEEKMIVGFFGAKYWYVTNVSVMRFSNSIVKFALLKPVPEISMSFNLNREVIAVFSPYVNFEPRVLDAIENLDLQGLRTEEVCSIVVSKDPEVEQHINSIVRTNQESRIIVPFTYDELKSQTDNEFVINRIRHYFYSRDLFGIQDPLKKEAFFFGRNELIHELVNKHQCGETAGLFGLRKTGKTSIIYGIKRVCDRKKSVVVIIDCQILHLKPWNLALESVISQAKEECQVKKTHLQDPAVYQDTSKASDAFAIDIRSLYYNNDRRSIFLIFDEIENISFGTSASDNWKSGSDFIKFWQVLRSSYQKLEKNVFTYLIAGTNPTCIELPTINGTDNPVFSQFKPSYISPFDFDLTKSMLDKLGGYMGLSFEPEVCARLVEDYGGHPMLIRQICSYIHKRVTASRPFVVDVPFYDETKIMFEKEDSGSRKYVQMVLEVLQKWYKDEYDLLVYLATEDYDSFNLFAQHSTEYTSHLLNYGLVEYSKSVERYVFKVNSIKHYLLEKNKYRRVAMTDEEKQSEISTRRNALEPKLRNLVRRQLRSTLGEETAKSVLIRYLKKGSIDTPYNDFFDPTKFDIYLSTLFTIIRTNYEDVFKNIFNENVEIFRSKTDLINHYRYVDAHAGKIDENEFNSFRGAMGWLEGVIENYE